MGIHAGLVEWGACTDFYAGIIGHALGLDVCVSAASEESVWQAGFVVGQLVRDVYWCVVVVGCEF